MASRLLPDLSRSGIVGEMTLGGADCPSWVVGGDRRVHPPVVVRGQGFGIPASARIPSPPRRAKREFGTLHARVLLHKICFRDASPARGRAEGSPRPRSYRDKGGTLTPRAEDQLESGGGATRRRFTTPRVRDVGPSTIMGGKAIDSVFSARILIIFLLLFQYWEGRPPTFPTRETIPAARARGKRPGARATWL